MKPKIVLTTACVLALQLARAVASTAYGDLNNFDVVNDTGQPCHGFEIELVDVHSKDITYTYDWSHYGVPKITEDNTDPLHPRTFIRFASAKNPDGSWAAYTAVPTGPIAPTQGHQFTDTSVNFGGEHFGAGYYGTPGAVRYNWLLDDGAGNLIHGPAVLVATPSFVYYPPAGGAPAQVQAAIVPPPPPAPPVLEFGDAMWVKEIRTTTHNAIKVELRDLVSDDPDLPNDKNWRNGEPDEVEVEWQILQTDYNSGNGGANGELKGAAEDLPGGNEVITRRYEFYKYTGPLDPETGEALGDKVGPDGLHGVGSKIALGVTYDLAGTVVVGDFIGAQMAGFAVAAPLGLIDNLQDGDLELPYVERTLVIGGNSPYVATLKTGALPPGMGFNPATGVLSGTPTVSGVYAFTVEATDADLVTVSKTYSLNIVAPLVVTPLTISGVTVSSITETEATITWTTDQAASSVVILDGVATVLDSTLVTAHSALLSGLTPSATYTYSVASTSAAGETVISLDSTFTTATPPPVICNVANATITFVNKHWLDVVIRAGEPVTHVHYTPTAAGTVFQGVAGFAVGELVDYAGTLDPVGWCQPTSMTVKPAPAPIAINPAALPTATIGQPYSAIITVTGGLAPTTITGVSGLPPELVWNGVSVDGTPAALGNLTLVVSAMDARGLVQNANVQLQVVDVPVVFTVGLPAGTIGNPYSATLRASGGYGAFTYSAPGLPAGLSLVGSTISGIPTLAGSFPIVLTATDAVGSSVSASITLVIANPVTNFTVKDEGQGRITAFGDHYIMIGTKKIIWDAGTVYKLNNVSKIAVGMKAQWKGFRDAATNTVRANKLEIN